MKVLGITALGHDASVALVEDDKILFAAHAERYSRIKNDPFLNQDILNEVLKFGKPDVISYYENPINKKLRQLKAGQYNEVFKISDLFSQHFKKFKFPKTKIIYQNHHKSHAATGYYTSPFNDCVVLCIDAIGEFKTISIWKGSNNKLELIESMNYPHSLGLMYSAFTQYIGLKPNEEEYILMGMVGYGKPIYAEKIKNDFIQNDVFRLNFNFHKGLPKNYFGNTARDVDIAASIQKVTEECIAALMKKASKISDNLVYVGGVALNCSANKNIHKIFKNVWIPNNPGDSGSAIGACALVTQQKINSESPFLGYDIKGDYPIKGPIEELLKGNIIGIANSKAEFGPRAFGNRSLLADPRGPNIKDKVNTVKKRQKFRPFSPVILEEEAHKYFEMYTPKSPYMQYVFKCKFPDDFPAIVHIDGTSRVQTVPKNNSGIRKLLEAFFEETGCPMLLNTSLNIKGEPLINNEEDAKRFEEKHNIKVF